MSTVRVVNLQHPDSVEPNVVLNTDGTATFASGVTVSGFNNISVSGTAQFASGTAASPSLTFEDDSDTGIYSPAGNQIAFTASGVEQARLTTSGTNFPKLGIGNTDPEALLTLGSFTGPTQLIRMRTSSGQVLGLDMGDSNDVDGGRVRYYLSDSSLRFSTDSTLRIRIDSDGLKFGADTAAANALDDYEEGTFTPTLEGGTAYSRQDGYYTKVGSQVYFYIRIQASAATGNTNRWQIFGLPFASTNTDSAFGGAFRNYGDHLPKSNFPDLNFHITQNATSIRAYNGQTTLLSNNSNITLTRQLILNGFYRTDS